MDGTAIVLCEGCLDIPSGKTAHGLIRGTDRYDVRGVIDSRFAGRDAGEALGGTHAGIPCFESLGEAVAKCGKPDYLVMGIAPDGGMLPDELKPVFVEALKQGINVDAGLHQQLSEIPELAEAAAASGAAIRDVRRCKPVSELHFFEGKIEQVDCLVLAVLGTDSAVGKRTTSRILMEALRADGIKTEMVGTGQTAWFQGMKYCMLLDATINDFVAGEIEHAVYEAWRNESPDVIIIEGQGCMTNPAFPGGFEILAAGRPSGVILQHAPKRKYYDGFPGYEIAGIDTEMKLIELLTGKSVIAITINHEGMTAGKVDSCTVDYEKKYGIPAVDVILQGPQKITDTIKDMIRKQGDESS